MNQVHVIGVAYHNFLDAAEAEFHRSTYCQNNLPNEFYKLNDSLWLMVLDWIEEEHQDSVDPITIEHVLYILLFLAAESGEI